MLFQPNPAPLPEEPPRSSLCVACLHLICIWWQLFLKSKEPPRSSSNSFIFTCCASCRCFVFAGSKTVKWRTSWCHPIVKSRSSIQNLPMGSCVYCLQGYTSFFKMFEFKNALPVPAERFSEIFGNAPLSLKRVTLLLGSLQWFLRQSLAAPGVPSA